MALLLFPIGLLRRSALLAAACALALAAAAPAAAVAAPGNLEEKMKYERSLEEKVEQVLANLLGPGKSRVMIRASLDFSTKENLQMEGSKQEGPEFSWQNINKEGGGGKELLPGFSDDSKGASGGGGNYQREVIVPQSIVKKLTVSLVLSDSIAEPEAQKVRQVVSDLLAMSTARGDELLVTRVAFAPIWYTSEMLGTLVKYGLIALIAIMGMAIVAVGFLKMASAMGAAGGLDSATNIRMEMAGAGAGEGGPGAEPGGFALALPGRPQEAAAAAPQGAPGSVVFNIRPEKLEILVRLLSKDEPADIALIAMHLPQALRPRFLSLLPAKTATEVLASIAKVRFIEPDIIARVKEELERRLDSAVGGYDQALEAIEGAALGTKSELIKALQRAHPEIGAAVRARVMLMEDLDLLEPNEFSILAGTVPVAVWGLAIDRLTEAGRNRLKTELTAGAWKTLQQAAAYSTQSADKIDGAAEQVLAAAARLMEEGRIKRPAGKTQGSLPAGTAPGKPEENAVT
jgi:hypothetical protein